MWGPFESWLSCLLAACNMGAPISHFISDFLKMVIMIMIILSYVFLVILTVSKEKNKKGAKAYTRKRNKKAISKFHKNIPDKPYLVMKKRDDKNFEGEFMEIVPEEYTSLYQNKVLVFDKDNDDIILVAKFNSFNSMSEELKHEFNELTKKLLDLKGGAAEIKINSAKSHGQMFSIGWRGGMQKGKSLGRYSPSTFMQQTPSRIQKWEEDQKTVLKWISSFYLKRFKSLAPSLSEVMLKEAKESNIPDFSDCEFHDLESESAFVNNLVFTVDKFDNRMHKDNDKSSYAFGIFAPIFKNNGNLATHIDGFTSVGGQFILPSYKCSIDFGRCDGIVELIWRANKDFHGTVPSEFSANFSRIGSSVQISETLVGRIRNLMVEKKNGKNINGRVKGLNEIVIEKLQKFESTSEAHPKLPSIGLVCKDQ